MDRLQAMAIFTRVIEARSFRKAAETMSLPASTATKAIKDLETYLGVRLLNRTTRQLSLTSEGGAYYDRCKKILVDVGIAEAAFAGRHGRPRGNLRVDMTPSFARLYLIPNLAEFRRNYPDVELTLTLSDRVVDLVQEGVDCVIRAGIPQTSATLIAKRIAGFEWIVCGSPDYLKSHGEPGSIEGLQHHHAVGYLSSRTGRTLEWEFLQAGERRAVRMIEHVIVNDTDAYVAAGLQGLGLIRAASYMVLPYLRDGRLRRILADLNAPIEPLSIMYPQNRHLSPTVRAFVDWCAATISKLGKDWVRPEIRV